MALTGNFLIDTGMQEQTATPVSGYKPNPTEEVIKNLASPTETIPKTRTQEQLFSDMKKLEQSGFTGSQEELLKEVVGYAKSKGITFDGVNSDEILGIMQEPVQEEEIEIEEDMEGLDIGLEVSEGLQELGKGLKVESKFDIKPMSETTGVVDTFKNEGKRLLNSLRFAANLPGDTIEMAGELIGVASNVVGTARSVKDIGVGIADKLGLVEGTEEQQAIPYLIWNCSCLLMLCLYNRLFIYSQKAV